ncbi:MAG: tetratricopeptide repeat protein [Devosia sp.]|nr:tetratricopeptide repeat protein [Devosia sp.]
MPTNDLFRSPGDRPSSAGDRAAGLLRDGLALHRQGKLDQAAARYQRVIAALPGDPRAKHLLGLVEHQRGNQARAHELIELAVAAQPRNADYLSDLALVLSALGRRQEAIERLRAALVVRPGDARALNMLGGLLVQQGRHAEAVECYRAALQREPRSASLHNNLGSALTVLGDLAGAIAALRQALAIDPGHVDAHSNLGYALTEADALDAAIVHCREALRLSPDAVGPRFNLGLALLKNRDFTNSAEAFTAVLERQPRLVEAMRGLGDALIKLGRTEEGIAQYKLAVAERPSDAGALGSLLFHENYRADGDPEGLVEVARRYGRLITDSAPVARRHTNDPDPERRLRVGLVSADLATHAVARFLDAPLAAIDPQQIELFAYATSKRVDAMTERLRASIPNWRQVTHMPDGELAQAITNDRIDILVDLSGHSSGQRLKLFARKPAPIAVTWLGYFATTGLSAIDYVLANRWVIPEVEARQWVETPWYLPDTYLCFSPPPVAVETGPPPAVGNGLVTFGSANNLNKLSDRTVRCWADVLKQVPHSRLLLRTAALGEAEMAERTRRRFAAHDVGADRLVLQAAVTDYGAHLARYQDVDIALDPFPYAGGTTTIEALWMGVPVLTLRGDRYAAHMGESIMHNMGMQEWIASDTAEYVRRAAAVAADIDTLATLRGGLRQRLLASPLMDAPRFARNLEAAFRGMWQNWCAAQDGSAMVGL